MPRLSTRDLRILAAIGAAHQRHRAWKVAGNVDAGRLGRTTLRRVTDELTVLAAPAILHRDALHTVWHAGVVQGPSGAVVLTLQIDSPDERRFRDDPNWRLFDGPPPIDAYIELAHARSPVTGSFSFGPDRFAYRYHQRFQPVARDQVAGAQLHINIRPLELHLMINLLKATSPDR